MQEIAGIKFVEINGTKYPINKINTIAFKNYKSYIDKFNEIISGMSFDVMDKNKIDNCKNIFIKQIKYYNIKQLTTHKKMMNEIQILNPEF